jgi:hypothetical protein
MVDIENFRQHPLSARPDEEAVDESSKALVQGADSPLPITD